MTALSLFATILADYKTYAPVILTVASGVGMILTKDYAGGVSTIFSALTVLFGGTAVATLHASAVAQLKK